MKDKAVTEDMTKTKKLKCCEEAENYHTKNKNCENEGNRQNNYKRNGKNLKRCITTFDKQKFKCR